MPEDVETFVCLLKVFLRMVCFLEFIFFVCMHEFRGSSSYSLFSIYQMMLFLGGVILRCVLG